MLDTAIELETPEGVGIELRAAGLFARGMALLMDECIRWGIIIAVNVPLMMLGRFGVGLLLLLTFFVYWFYGVGFEVLRQGQTPGKRMQGLRVVHDDGTPIGLTASVLRNLLLVVDYLPAFYAAGIFSMMLSRDFRRLGDLAGGTLVVYAERSNGVRPAAGGDAPARPPPVPLSRAEQRAIIDFADRREQFSEDRRQELAMILTPVLGCAPAQSAAELERVANGLKGGSL